MPKESNELKAVKKEISDSFYGRKNKMNFIIIAPVPKEKIVGKNAGKIYDSFYEKIIKAKLSEITIFNGAGTYTTKDKQELFQSVYFLIGKDITEEHAKKFLKETGTESVIFNNKIIYDDGTEKTFSKAVFSKNNTFNGDSTTLIIYGEMLSFQFI